MNRQLERAEASPDERLERHCPHLAFIEPARYDRVIRLLEQRNAIYKPGGANGVHPIAGRPKKRTIWPGQHIFCGICGRLFRYGGHGQNDHLLCRGACEYRCWNTYTVDAPLAAKKLSGAILAEIESLPDFDAVLQDFVQHQVETLNSSRDERLAALGAKQAQTAQEISNLVAFIRAGRFTPTLQSELERLEAIQQETADSCQRVEAEHVDLATIVSSADIKRLAHEAMDRQSAQPYEFGRIMHELIPRIVVFPYRLCDGGGVVLRAHFQLRANRAGAAVPKEFRSRRPSQAADGSRSLRSAAACCLSRASSRYAAGRHEGKGDCQAAGDYPAGSAACRRTAAKDGRTRDQRSLCARSVAAGD